MTVSSDGEIIKSWFDPKNWECVGILVVALAGTTLGLVAAAATNTGYLT